MPKNCFGIPRDSVNVFGLDRLDLVQLLEAISLVAESAMANQCVPW